VLFKIASLKSLATLLATLSKGPPPVDPVPGLAASSATLLPDFDPLAPPALGIAFGTISSPARLLAFASSVPILFLPANGVLAKKNARLKAI